MITVDGEIFAVTGKDFLLDVELPTVTLSLLLS